MEIYKKSIYSTEEKMKIGKYQNMLVKQNISNFADLCLSKKSRERVLDIIVRNIKQRENPLLDALSKLNNK